MAPPTPTKTPRKRTYRSLIASPSPSSSSLCNATDIENDDATDVFKTPSKRQRVHNAIQLTPLSKLRRSLHSVPPRLPAREKERDILVSFLARRFPSAIDTPVTITKPSLSIDALDPPPTPSKSCSKRSARKNSPSHIHLSGTPGVGKTALVKEVLGSVFNDSAEVEVLWVNCLHVGGTEASILKKVTEACGIKSTDVEHYVYEHQVLLVLDELDEIPAIFAHAFENSTSKSGQGSALITISNVLLPLQNSTSLHLPFSPYTPTDLASILTALFSTPSSSTSSNAADNVKANEESAIFFDPNALKLLVRRLGKESGDLRHAREVAGRAMDWAMRRGVDKVEIEDVQNAFSKKVAAIDSPSKRKRGNMDQEDSVVAIGRKEGYEGLNLQSKIVLLAVYLKEEGGGGEDEFSVYKKLLKWGELDILTQLGRGEFGDVMQGLEGMGYLTFGSTTTTTTTANKMPITPKKSPRKKRDIFGRSNSSTSLVGCGKIGMGTGDETMVLKDKKRVEEWMGEAKGEEGGLVKRLWEGWRRRAGRKVLQERGEEEDERLGTKWRGEDEKTL